MIKSLICLLLCCIQFSWFLVDGALYEEQYRLQLHYSPPHGWSNDPNGLIFAFGAYQMYFQHNPDSLTPQQMSWGHAKSHDLIHWQYLPVAIHSFDGNSIFSGCAVLDRENLTGVIPSSSNGVVPIIAIYTLNNDATQLESQAMSYSLDGLTFKPYKSNPIIPGRQDFRDPNVIRRNGEFLMTLVSGTSVQFWSSRNFLNWTHVSDFGGSASDQDRTGVWECSSMITLKDQLGTEHDVLLISVSTNMNRYGRNEYFVGKWNGNAFTSDSKGILRVDNGFDLYAGVPYHNDPLGRVIFMAWMANTYAPTQPTSTWRGQFTIPRELFLKMLNGTLYLQQRPIHEFYTLIDNARSWSLEMPLNFSNYQSLDLSLKFPFEFNSLLTLKYAIDIKNPIGGKVGFRIGNKNGEFVSFSYNVENSTYVLDRSKSGNVSFDPAFANALVAQVKRKTNLSLLTGCIILDTASIEIFADDGVDTFTAQFFPTKLYDSINLEVDLKYADLTTFPIIEAGGLTATALKSIWK